MVISNPTRPIFTASLADLNIFTLNSFKPKNRMIAENKILNQTSGISFREISLPKTPVNPASNTAMCSVKYDLFTI